MLRYILIGFALYFLYRFIFELVIPVYRTTKQVKKQFDSVRQQHSQNSAAESYPKKQPVNKTNVDKSDYIEFEEI
jgi:hypothetical protein